ncbi:MAG: hypothetical protein QM778_20700 [Myxococcales bacterium]
MLLLVLVVVMMMSGLAGFAAQNGTFEVRSVGGTRQLSRLRRSGESFLVVVGAFLAERFVGGKGTVSIADTRWMAAATTSDPNENLRRRYNLPEYVSDTSLMQVGRNEFGGASFPLGKATLPKDAEINSGTVTPFEFDGIALLERYDMPADAGQGMGVNAGMQSGLRNFRVCATAYSRLLLPGDTGRTGEARQLHESLGISRAYFDLR